jgi:hypothetical protein
MSSEQIKGLITPINAPQEDDKPLIAPEQQSQKAEADDQKNDIPNTDDQEAGNILSAPVQEEPMGTSKVLKTRADLIQKINEISDRRGDDIKHLNLKRRRKKSLENILASKFAEAAEHEMEQQHTVHPDLQEALPEGTEARTQFALDMVFRLDLTLCALMEKGVSATDGFHGLTCDGFARSIEENPTLTSEIKACWLEILSEPDNEWILESCTTSARLFLCHCYGLMNVLRQKQRKHVEFAIPPAGNLHRQNFPHKASENVAPRKHTGKLRDIMRERQKGRENNIDEKPLPQRTGGLVKPV